MAVLRIISLLIFAAFVGVGTVFSQTKKQVIAECGCDAACFTDEVSGLSCTVSQFSFQSHGLPDTSHSLMVGIVGNNQQFPSVHNLEFSLPRHPELASTPTQTVAGAIGVAINGVPIFDPSMVGGAAGWAGLTAGENGITAANLANLARM